MSARDPATEDSPWRRIGGWYYHGRGFLPPREYRPLCSSIKCLGPNRIRETQLRWREGAGQSLVPFIPSPSLSPLPENPNSLVSSPSAKHLNSFTRPSQGSDTAEISRGACLYSHCREVPSPGGNITHPGKGDFPSPYPESQYRRCLSGVTFLSPRSTCQV